MIGFARRAAQRQPRGQTLVLSALSFLVLALMLMLSFNLNQAIHGKIALQQNSDAVAYSKAIVEARALNYFAYSNRAIAASYVAMTSLHAYMASVTITANMFKAARINFIEIAIEELAQCDWYAPQHCLHSYQAFRISNKFNQSANDYKDKAESLDQNFEDAQNALENMVVLLHASQDAAFGNTASTLNSGLDPLVNGVNAKSVDGFNTILNGNAPQSTESGTVRALNTTQFTCAIDGMPCATQSSTSTATHAEEMTEIANATRPNWPANRAMPVGEPTHLSLTFLDDLMQKIQNNDGITLPIPFLHLGTAKVIDNQSKSDLHAGSSSSDTGKVIGADEHGWLFSEWKDGVGLWDYSAEVYSASDNGSHKNGGHQGEHKFGGVNTKSLTACVGSGNCFMKFRSTDSKPDFGQPKTYGYSTQPVRNLANGSPGPWALGDQGKFSYTFGSKKTTIDMAGGDAAAFSKGMVYYHRIGDWQEQPNLFGPYWRAKLHPFTSDEAVSILSAAGNADAAAVAAASGLPF